MKNLLNVIFAGFRAKIRENLQFFNLLIFRQLKNRQFSVKTFSIVKLSEEYCKTFQRQ